MTDNATMDERPDPPVEALPSPRDLARLHAADVAAYGQMYRAAGALGAGCAVIDGALAMWNPGDESAAYNCLVGFEEAPDPDAAWAAAEAAARAGGARVFGVGINPPRHDWATSERLAALGLVPEYPEAVWFRRLAGGRPPVSLPPGVQLRTEGFGASEFARLLNRGWELPENHGRGRLYAAALGLPGWTHYLATADGIPAAGACLCVHGGVGLCMVATTLPAYRGRGLQGLAIARRLADAAAAGCDLAASETVNDNASPRNMRRAGFRLLHVRQVYRKEL